METIQINSLEQVPGAINLIFKRFDELQAQLNNKPSQLPTTVAPDELLTRQQAADVLKVSLPTLNELTKSGALKAYRIPGTNRPRYKTSDVTAALTAIKPAKPL